MERALKERIIGAVVLVLFVVLVVPVFLDGPPVAGETVSQRVLLPGQEGQERKTVILDRERSVPIPAVETATPATQDSAQAAEPQQADDMEIDRAAAVQDNAVVAANDTQSTSTKPVAVPRDDKPVGTAAPSVSSSTGMWAVQLGSFAVRENAEKLQASLRKQGYAAFLSQVTNSGNLQYRVRIGPQKDRAGAETTAAQLLKANHRGQVVPHP